MKKKIIFFDGDGTLWYPIKTRRTVKPHLLYEKFDSPRKYLPHLSLTPSLVKILNKLKSKGVILVALSTHPHSVKEADKHMQSKIAHFELENIFDQVLTARANPAGKGRVMIRVLKKLKISKSQALMVGDSYVYDYLSARGVGIDCLLIKTKYLDTRAGKVKSTISHLKELLK